MPNFCKCVLELKNKDPQALARLVDPYLQGELFKAIKPIPEELIQTAHDTTPSQEEENKRCFGFKDWYDWSIHNWGTKWDIGQPSKPVDIPGGGLKLKFETAWSPPLKIVDALIAQGYSAHLMFFEPLECFAGVYGTAPDGAKEDRWFKLTDFSFNKLRRILPKKLEAEFGIVKEVKQILEGAQRGELTHGLTLTLTPLSGPRGSGAPPPTGAPPITITVPTGSSAGGEMAWPDSKELAEKVVQAMVGSMGINDPSSEEKGSQDTASQSTANQRTAGVSAVGLEAGSASERVCTGCGVRDEKLKWCSGCMQALFCSVECSRKSWPAHREECRAVAAAKKG